MSEMKDAVTRLGGMLDNATAGSESARYLQLEAEINKMMNALRESFQKTSAKTMDAVLAKLRGSDPISTDEMNLIRIWIVGDAEQYVKYENNYDDWVADLKRIRVRLASLPGDAGDTLEIKALFQDALRSVADIAHYLDAKERVKKFDDAVRELDRGERQTLYAILSGMRKHENV